ncbi:MAG: LDCC motif putative metal-binding protein [Eubacterium sp.]|nr:LDCC motif putative metal-binding protein [Eubacterium sp.]
MSVFSSIKEAWDAWLARMAKSNQEAFGGETPDCCKINRDNNQLAQKNRDRKA